MLKENAENGLGYHHPGGLKRDYDQLDSEDEVMQLIQFGRNNPYQALPEAVERVAALRAKGFVPVDIAGGKHYFMCDAVGLDPYVTCPVLQSEHWQLKQVEEADAQDLLRCYSDPLAQRFFNADRCTSSFRFTQLEEMVACIQSWMQCYQRRDFVRWSIFDRSSGRAVGTVEMFGDPQAWSVLRLDLAADYETRVLLKELLDLAAQHFFALFKVKQMLTKVFPGATQRLAALEAAAFVPVTVAGRENYVSLERS